MSSSNPVHIKLNDVRLSYPSLFRKTVHPKAGPDAKPMYQATFILDKDQHASEIKLINERINQLIEENRAPKNKIRICFKDGDDEDREEYKNKYILTTKNSNAFPIVGKDGKTPVHENENIFYGGCYVSAYISLYFYDKVSMGISSNLQAIQFRKDGPSFNHTMNLEGAFEAVEDSSDDLF